MRVGVGLAQQDDFSVTVTQEDLTEGLEFPATPRELWAGREGPLSMD